MKYEISNIKYETEQLSEGSQRYSSVTCIIQHCGRSMISQSCSNQLKQCSDRSVRSCFW